MIILFASTLIFSQVSTRWIPALSPSLQKSLVHFRDPSFNRNKYDPVDTLFAKPGLVTKKVPAEYKRICDKLLQEVLGVSAVNGWNGYISDYKYVSQRKQSFVVSTLFTSVTKRGVTTTFIVNQSGVWIFFEGIGVPLELNPVDRQAKIISVIGSSSTFDWHDPQYVLVDPTPAPGGIVADIYVSSEVTVRRGLERSAQLTEERWWSYFNCMSNSQFLSVRLLFTGWQDRIGGKDMTNAFYKRPNSDLSPLDEKYWVKQTDVGIGGK